VKGRKAGQIAYLGMLTALAFILSYVESILPISLGIPGVKIGLANLTVMVALYTVGVKEALCLSFIRIILVGFTFGNLASMMYSVAGGVVSFLVMVVLFHFEIFTETGVSIAGGVAHNLGQLLVAVLVVENAKLLFYFPVLCFSGTVAGCFIGVLAAMIIKRVKKVYKQ